MNTKNLLKADALLPLHAATRICYAALYGHRIQDVPLFDEQLTRLANAIVGLVPVYARKPAESLGRRVKSIEWAQGAFRRGGREVHFADGRPPLLDLHVARASLDGVIAQLRKQDQCALKSG